MSIDAVFENISDRIVEEISKANQTIYIAVAWFTNERILDALVDKAAEGCVISLIISNDSINNNGRIDHDRLNIGRSKVYRIGDGEIDLMHNKFCVIDRTTVISGSYNWSYKADTNLENVLVCQDPDLARQFIYEFSRIRKVYYPEENDKEDAQLPLDSIIKRLEVLKNLVLLEELDQLKVFAAKLKEYENNEDIHVILGQLKTKNYAKAVKSIETFIVKYSPITGKWLKSRVHKLYNKAFSLIISNQVGADEDFLQNHINDPNYRAQFRLKGEASGVLKAAESAMKVLHELLVIDPSNKYAYELAGLIELRIHGDSSSAEKYIEKGLNIDNTDVHLLVSLGTIQYEYVNWASALSFFDKAISYNDKYAFAHIMRSDVLRWAYNDWVGAMENLNGALENYSLRADWYMQRAQRREGKDRIDDYTSAIELEEENAEAYIRRGEAWLQLSYANRQNRDSHHRKWCYEKAESDFERACELDSDSKYETLVLLGGYFSTYAEMARYDDDFGYDDYREAIRCYTCAIEINREFGYEAYKGRSFAHYNFFEILRTDHRNEHDIPLGHYRGLDIDEYNEAGNRDYQSYQKAERREDEECFADSADSSDHSILEYLEDFWLSDSSSQSLDQLEDPRYGDPKLFAARADIRFKRGDYQNAIDAYDTAVYLGLNCPGVYFNRSISHQSTGNQQNAAKDWKEFLQLMENKFQVVGKGKYRNEELFWLSIIKRFERVTFQGFVHVTESLFNSVHEGSEISISASRVSRIKWKDIR